MSQTGGFGIILSQYIHLYNWDKCYKEKITY